VGAKQVWQRLNGLSPTKEEELEALKRESAALLSLRAEATKLRGGIRLVQRQKEMKASLLLRSGADDLLEETLRADISIMKLQKELSLKAARLELERIFITLESELTSNSALVDQLLDSVERYGAMEGSLVEMFETVQQGRHAAVDQALLTSLERDVAQMLLNLGLQEGTTEAPSWDRTYETLQANAARALQGLQFYARGVQLLGDDVQLVVNMLARAVLQGYTLRSREVKLLRRIAKDILTIVPFVIILIIPLTPLGHVLIFSFIQRFFPDFFPSQFTESRQNIMSMYSSITAPPDAATKAEASPAASTAAAADTTDGGSAVSPSPPSPSPPSPPPTPQ